tara:strand:+ start:13622 stop:14080 length:459 start_codon:yes stop_codon:yes gene_type:complete
MKVAVQAEDFRLEDEIAHLRGTRTDLGALVTFTGLVRDFHGERKIHRMTLEHFPGMAERQLTELAHTAMKRWDLQDVTLIHRYGSLDAGEQIVLVITAAAHRQAAFEAAQFLMDWLKTDAPFWKKEYSDHGTEWVESREEDTKAREKWLKNP